MVEQGNGVEYRIAVGRILVGNFMCEDPIEAEVLLEQETLRTRIRRYENLQTARDGRQETAEGDLGTLIGICRWYAHIVRSTGGN
jgi:hypothetical protein